MKLRNKKTGEVVSIYEILTEYDSLAGLDEEWEDYEEPKEYWFIDDDGGISDTTFLENDEYDQKRLALGNYFESREEAERAVEKLKAWKRLRDKGMSLKLDSFRSCIDYRVDLTPLKDEEAGNIAEDLDLLFGKEEE